MHFWKPAAALAAVLFASGACAQTAAIGIEDNVSHPMKLVKMVRPVYPPEAKSARLSGKVRLEAVIDKEGKIAELRISSGHPLLASAAYEAVRQWEYAPVQKDGQPLAVRASIDINFSLEEGGPPPVEVPGSVQVGRLTHKVRPEYPPDAKQARVQGTVRLRATIAKDGAVDAIRVLEGDPGLTGAAVDAVKQWQYEPAMVDGAPAAVITDIDVNFVLSPQ